MSLILDHTNNSESRHGLKSKAGFCSPSESVAANYSLVEDKLIIQKIFHNEKNTF